MKGYELVEWALTVPVDRGVDRLVLVTYARYRNRRSGHAFPGMAILEAAALVERKAVIAARTRLVNRGLLVKVGRRGRTGIQLYALGCPLLGMATPVENHTSKSQERDDDAHVEIPKARGESPQSGTPKGPKSGTQNSEIEPIEEPERPITKFAEPKPGWWLDDRGIEQAAKLVGIDLARIGTMSYAALKERVFERIALQRRASGRPAT